MGYSKNIRSTSRHCRPITQTHYDLFVDTRKIHQRPSNFVCAFFFPFSFFPGKWLCCERLAHNMTHFFYLYMYGIKIKEGDFWRVFVMSFVWCLLNKLWTTKIEECRPRNERMSERQKMVRKASDSFVLECETMRLLTFAWRY